MKKILKKIKPLIPVYIISLVFSFMLFLYEPLILYANNIDDFWFDIYIIILPISLMFSITFIAISIIYTIIYFLNKKFGNKMYIYNFSVTIFFIIFVYLYIQGNYLIGDLPILDGAKIVWDNYFTQNIISIFIFVIIIIVQIILILKLKFKSFLKVINYVSLAIMAMLFTSLISVLLTTNTFSYKDTPATMTNKNINIASKDTNFFILVLDSIDSMYFNDILEKDNYDFFNDFTYYPDTMGAYGYTKYSIPFILSGKWHEANSTFNRYSTDSLNESPLLKMLFENEYTVNIYESQLVWDDSNSRKIANSVPIGRELNLVKFIKQELKYILFKYLPYNLKKYSKIHTLNYDSTKKIDEGLLYDYHNLLYYDKLKNNTIEITDDKIFQFIHIEGAHVPFDMDEDLNVIEDGTYSQKIRATLKIVELFLNRLKENEVYDNSAIIIMSDHGYNFSDHNGRQNPILLVKGINEHHKSMKKSEKSVSFEDLNDVYLDLLDGKHSTQLFKEISDKRERKYILYDLEKCDYMYEYIQKGKAWDEDTLIATGKEYTFK